MLLLTLKKIKLTNFERMLQNETENVKGGKLPSWTNQDRFVIFVINSDCSKTIGVTAYSQEYEVSCIEINVLID